MRFAMGVLGNAACLFLYASPILTFKRVIRKGSEEGFSCVPYVVTLFNCLIITWYSLPVVSRGWENYLVVTINGLGIVLELSFILIYCWFASSKTKVKVVAGMVLPAILIFSVIAATSGLLFNDHPHRKLYVGTFGLVASAALYGAPLVAVSKVIQTRSVEFMPFYLSLFSFLASSIWLAYWLLSADIILAVPNVIGSALSILQLVVYYKYKDMQKTVVEPEKGSIETIPSIQLGITSDVAIKI